MRDGLGEIVSLPTIIVSLDGGVFNMLRHRTWDTSGGLLNSVTQLTHIHPMYTSDTGGC